MKVMLFGHKSSEIEEEVKQAGLELVTENPEVIITYGGDGTLLSSEREFPGVPKLAIRDNSICKKCTSHLDEKLFKRFAESNLKLSEFPKLETQFNNKTLLALNDFVIRNQLPTHAIRFIVLKNSEQVVDKLIIGDGVVASTAFGSSGYFKSITQETFSDNFAIAFNNTTEKINPVPFKQDDLITVKIIRGPATLSLDNSPDIYTLEGNSEIDIKASSQTLKQYEANTLRCPDCEITRSLNTP